MPTTRISALALAACPLAIAAIAPAAAEVPPLVQAPANLAPPQSTVAAMFNTTVQLSDGRGIARVLIELGVAADEAADVAKLAAGHLGEGKGGCAAKIEISRVFDGSVRNLWRLVLTTTAGDTVIERRGGKLSLVPTAALRAKPLRIA